MGIDVGKYEALCLIADHCGELVGQPLTFALTEVGALALERQLTAARQQRAAVSVRVGRAPGEATVAAQRWSSPSLPATGRGTAADPWTGRTRVAAADSAPTGGPFTLPQRRAALDEAGQRLSMTALKMRHS